MSYLQETSFWSILYQEDIRGYESEVKLWLKKFQSIQDINKKQLDDALKAGILKMTKIQMKKFKIEFDNKRKKEDISEDLFFKMVLEYLKPNSEYDTLLVIKRLQLFIHVEVKSASNKVNVSSEETAKYVSTSCLSNTILCIILNLRNLRSRYASAKEQLRKGERMFVNIMKPLAELTDDWTYYGFVAFPEVENRKELNQYLNLEDDYLKVKYLHILVTLLLMNFNLS